MQGMRQGSTIPDVTIRLITHAIRTLVAGPRCTPLILVAVFAMTGSADARASCSGCRVPRVGASWQWQLSGKIDADVSATVFDVDAIDASDASLQRLRLRNRYLICYISAGSWERWRDDADDFPQAVLGRALDGWPGERWLDVRMTRVLRPIMRRRMAECSRRGFDAVEADNVDGWDNQTGFRITGRDQLRYNRMLAHLAHGLGLAIALKNDGPQVTRLVAHFEMAIVEECFANGECEAYRPFVRAGKPVFVAEYAGSISRLCRRAQTLRFSVIRKRSSLGSWRATC